MSKPKWLALAALASMLVVFLLFPLTVFAADNAPAPDVGALAGAIADHKWTLVAAAAIGFVVRLLKDDVRFLPTIPARWRPVVALALGIVSGVLLKLEPGKTWTSALLEGAIASFLAMGGHSIVIEALRGGRELGAPKADDAPTKPKLPPDPPSGPAGALGVLLLAIVAATAVHGCAAAAETAHTGQQMDCVEQAKTLEESTACRKLVRDAWATDAGADR